MKTPEQIAIELIAKNRSGSYEKWIENTVEALKEYALQELERNGIVITPSKAFLESIKGIDKALKKGKPAIQEYPLIELKNPKNPKP